MKLDMVLVLLFVLLVLAIFVYYAYQAVNYDAYRRAALREYAACRRADDPRRVCGGLKSRTTLISFSVFYGLMALGLGSGLAIMARRK